MYHVKVETVIYLFYCAVLPAVTPFLVRSLLRDVSEENLKIERLIV